MLSAVMKKRYGKIQIIDEVIPLCLIAEQGITCPSAANGL